MANILYRASFFLYEISFVLFALALWYHSMSLRKINRALHQPPYWLWPAVGSVFLLLTAFNHYFVYHYISPFYMQTHSYALLIRMYVLKTVSMGCILAAGLTLLIGNLMYIRRIK
ncbi:hypothetical protein JW933_06240 [candidate division FCPU426 bacterium]|nr:hypothetical protein [candidate division FCPU426 bacterium]